MGRGRSSLELILLAFSGLLLLNLADSTARYLATSYFGTFYVMGTAIKAATLVATAVLAVLFAIRARSQASGRIITPRTVDVAALLAVATAMLFVDMKAFAFLGLALPYIAIDALWFALFGIVLVGLPVLISARVRRAFGWRLAVIPILIATGFSLKLVDHLYFVIQNLTGLAPPISLAVAGMLGPSVAIASAGFVALVAELHRRPVSLPSGSLLGLLAIPLVSLVPPAIHSLGVTLPNLIFRGWVFWSLGYVGYGWYTPSLLAAAFVTYVFLLSRLRSTRPPERLLFLALLTFPLNGIFVLFLDYSSIPGNLLSLLAAAVALDMATSGAGTP